MEMTSALSPSVSSHLKSKSRVFECIILTGSYALNSLRLEKSFGIWSREYTPEFTALESALDPFVTFKKKTDFIGRTPALAEKENDSSSLR